jgi:cellobiose transport system permease protein
LTFVPEERMADFRQALRRSNWHLYVAISPFFVLFAIFGIGPLVYAGWLSLHRWNGLSDPVFVGFNQFVRLVRDGAFLDALTTTVLIFVMAQIPLVIGALAAAAILSRLPGRARAFYQTALFVPQITSLVMVAIVFQSLFSGSYGIINRGLSAIGLPVVDWLVDWWGIKWVIAFMVIWRGFGFFMVIFLAGLAAIPPALYDAAKIDGASPFRTFWHITLPLLRPTVVFVVVISSIGGLQLFTEPQVLFNGLGGPGNAGRTIMLLQYQYLGSTLGSAALPDLGYATTISIATFMILLVVSIAQARTLRRNLQMRED